MDQYELMRTAQRVYKKSIRQISRETGHTRKTIRKVLQGLEPKYRRKEEPACVVMDPVAVHCPRPKQQVARVRIYSWIVRYPKMCGLRHGSR